MYPKINELISELHKRRMSTFLVTNAQFPDAMRCLKPVTQLYVSVDAATKESLKVILPMGLGRSPCTQLAADRPTAPYGCLQAVDRPLFKDFWERFQECLMLLKGCRQRTVYRLTLVSGWNMNEVAEYEKLLHLGEPDFIEIKARDPIGGC